jgi:peptidoglycan/LPS O-acetylase OafA/YrhL
MAATTAEWDRALDASQPEPARVRVRRRRRRSRDKRRDIQGLRMVAVVAVVINHLTGRLQGGFVGVDVFFVISGYLITGHLLREHAKHRRISLVDFYRRRVRRLFPAALVVIAATVVAAQIIFDTARARSVLTDGFFAAVFSANWRFIKTGTDYFAAGGPTSPLQHYWSLSVEEQFYVVWPLLLMAALLLVRPLLGRTKHAAAVSAAAVVAALSAGSLAYAAADPNQVVTYFSTFSRGWELGLGALLAIFAPYMRGSRRVLTALSWAGMAMIVCALFVVTPARFPFPWALLPCLGAGLVVTAKSSRASAWNPVLTNRVSNYIGDISYSIYVVHFPIVIFMTATRPHWDDTGYFVATLLIVGISMLLFHLIENPIRQSNWLVPKQARGHNVGTEHGLQHGTLFGMTAVVLGAALLTSAPSTGTAEEYAVIQGVLAAPTSAAPSAGPAAPVMGPALAALQGELRAALLASTWPAFAEPPDAARTSTVVGCGAKLQPAPTCTWGSGSHWLYLVGDSTSVAYTNAFIAMMPQLSGWRLRSAGGSGCPFAATVLNTEPGNQYAGNCLQRNAALVDEINRTRPKVVVVTARGGLDRGDITSQLTELKKVEHSVGEFVVLPPNPGGKDPGECYTKLSTPTDCVATATANYREELANDRTLATDLHGIFIDPTPFFCVNDYCPEFAGRTPTRRDSVHITEAYSKRLEPVILEALRERRVLAS